MKSLINFGVLLGSIYAVGVEAFQNPIRKPGPDPSVVFANGFYHLSVTSTHSHGKIGQRVQLEDYHTALLQSLN